MEQAILDKLQKILALAERGGTEAESAAAMAKAQELLALHNLSMADVQGHVRQEDKTTSHILHTGSRFDWRGSVAYGIAELCFCFAINTTNQKGGLTLIGKPSDIAVAQALAASVIATGEKLAREMPAGNSFRRSFLRGFADRIRSRCSQMKNAPKLHTSAGTELILHPLYKQRENEGREFARLQLGMHLSKGRSMGRVKNGAGYQAGQSAANSVSLGRNGVTAGHKRLT